MQADSAELQVPDACRGVCQCSRGTLPPRLRARLKGLVRVRLPGMQVAKILDSKEELVSVAMYLEGLLAMWPGWLARSHESNAVIFGVAAELLAEVTEVVR